MKSWEKHSTGDDLKLEKGMLLTPGDMAFMKKNRHGKISPDLEEYLDFLEEIKAFDKKKRRLVAFRERFEL